MEELFEEVLFDEIDNVGDIEINISEEHNPFIEKNPFGTENPFVKKNPFSATFGNGECWSCSGEGYTTWTSSGVREQCWDCGGSGIG